MATTLPVIDVDISGLAFSFDLNSKIIYSLINFIFGLHVALIPIIHHCEF